MVGGMTKKSRDDWTEAALDALQRGGIDGVRVETLAPVLGVTKGSFYHHFDNRRSLLVAMLIRWERMGTDAIITLVNEGGGDPIDRLRTLLGVATTPPKKDGADIDAQLRAWASIDTDAAETIARVDAKRIAYVVDLLVASGVPQRQAELRSAALYRMLIGEYVWRSSGGPRATPEFLDEVLEMVTALD